MVCDVCTVGLALWLRLGARHVHFVTTGLGLARAAACVSFARQHIRRTGQRVSHARLVRWLTRRTSVGVWRVGQGSLQRRVLWRVSLVFRERCPMVVEPAAYHVV